MLETTSEMTYPGDDLFWLTCNTIGAASAISKSQRSLAGQTRATLSLSALPEDSLKRRPVLETTSEMTYPTDDLSWLTCTTIGAASAISKSPKSLAPWLITT